MVQPHTLGSTLAQDGHMVIHSSLHKSPFGKKKKKEIKQSSSQRRIILLLQRRGYKLVS